MFIVKQYMEMNMSLFFNTSSLNLFQISTFFCFGVESFTHQQSVINVAAMFCAAYLCKTSKALQLHHKFLGKICLLQSKGVLWWIQQRQNVLK